MQPGGGSSALHASLDDGLLAAAGLCAAGGAAAFLVAAAGLAPDAGALASVALEGAAGEAHTGTGAREQGGECERSESAARGGYVRARRGRLSTSAVVISEVAG